MAVMALILLASCRGGAPRPVEIEPSDQCARCKMAISQKQYSAELIDKDENVFKFDDIGCMLDFAGERRVDPAVPDGIYIFVRDYESREWVKGSTAYFVKSPKIQSPMASGLLAVSNRAKAAEYAIQFGGDVLSFSQIWKR